MESEAKLLLQKREEEILKQSEQLKQVRIHYESRGNTLAFAVIVSNNLIIGASCAERAAVIERCALAS